MITTLPRNCASIAVGQGSLLSTFLVNDGASDPKGKGAAERLLTATLKHMSSATGIMRRRNTAHLVRLQTSLAIQPPS